jgi:imidazolonepropionase-like amidohydrolase
MPGFVDAHNHLALTYKVEPERNNYYVTTILESTPLRAIQAASNGIQMLASGFTIVRDMGNNGNYADVALRQAIEQGWIPGPTIINSGIIIGGMGGQFSPTPEMAIDKKVVYPEYLDADTPDEIVKAVRQNMLFGARVIKICVDCKPWGYTVDEIKLVISEARKGGLKVEGHVQTVDGARRAIEAGIWSIAHDNGLTDDAQTDGAEGDLPSRHRNADHARRGKSHDASALQADGRRTKERVRQQGAADVLDRRRLLRSRTHPR